MHTQWHEASAIRERLYLLSELVIEFVADTDSPANWTYNTHHDLWTNGRYSKSVSREGSASLAVLANAGITYADAMALIGYPESR